MEFLTRAVIDVSGVPPESVADLRLAESERAHELIEQGHIVRLWRPESPRWENVGIWRARDQQELEALIASLPLGPYMDVSITPLLPHPHDPGAGN